jgi:DNA-binding CsgD family transcriptional regulator
MLAERAARLTPAEGDAAARLTAAARHSFDAGDPDRAIALLEQALGAALPGNPRARILLELGTVAGASRSLDAAVVHYRTGLAEAGADLRLSAQLHQRLAFALQLTDVQAARPEANEALQLAEEDGDPTIRAQALTTVAMVDFQLGKGVQHAPLETAIALEAQGQPLWLDESPRFVLAYQLVRVGELAAARREFTTLVELADARGDASVCLPLVSLAYVELRAGDLRAARAAAERGWRTAVECGRQLFEATALCARARVEIAEGNADTARLLTRRALALAVATGQTRTAADAHSALGALELSLGDYSAALGELEPALAARVAQGVQEPCLFYFLPDAVEALVGAGELERAETLLAPFEQRARTLERPWALATAGRARALLESANGRHDAAVDAAEEVVRQRARVPEPLELGRTLLVLGEARRRARKQKPAREALERALEIFDDLGARTWSDRAHAELARIGGRRTASSALTSTERRIAELVATGKTNHEVAAALFISPRTVEWNLSKVYRKLHVRTRGELAAKLARRPLNPGDSTGRAARPLR